MWQQQDIQYAEKLPLGNTVLKTLSLLDPMAFGQSETAILLKKLPSFFPTIDASDFNEEIVKMQSDMDILTGADTDLDVWWNSHLQAAEVSISGESSHSLLVDLFWSPGWAVFLNYEQHHNNENSIS